MTIESSLEDLVAEAVSGNAASLNDVVRRIKDDVYALAMRMLCHPADAEDATQEILIRVVTYLGTFEGRAQFRTWVYRVAATSLLNFKRGRMEAPMTFDEFAEDLREGFDANPPEEPAGAELRVLRNEVKIACTQAMLLCLDRDHRIAYVLGEILELSSTEAASIVEASAATYRKRVSRARQRVTEFTAASCGLVSGAAPCRCAGRVRPALATGRIDPTRLLFAEHPVRAVQHAEARAVADVIDQVYPSAEALMRSNPDYAAPELSLGELTPRVRST